MASKTFVYLAVLCFLQYSLVKARTVEAEQMSHVLSRRSIQRRDTLDVEGVKTRSQQLKARMSSAIQHVESEVQERSGDFATKLQEVVERMIDAGTRMLVEHMEAEAAQQSQGQTSQ